MACGGVCLGLGLASMLKAGCVERTFSVSAHRPPAALATHVRALGGGTKLVSSDSPGVVYPERSKSASLSEHLEGLKQFV